MNAFVNLLPIFVAALLLLGLAFDVYLRRSNWEKPALPSDLPHTSLGRGLLSVTRISILVMVFALIGVLFFHKFQLIGLVLAGWLGAVLLERLRHRIHG